MNKLQGEVIVDCERNSSDWTAVIDVEVIDGSPPQLISGTRHYDTGLEAEVNNLTVSSIDQSAHYHDGIEYLDYFEGRPDWLSFAKDALQNRFESGQYDQELTLLVPWSEN